MKGLSLNCRWSSIPSEVRRIGNDPPPPYANPPYANLARERILRADRSHMQSEIACDDDNHHDYADDVKDILSVSDLNNVGCWKVVTPPIAKIAT